MGSSHELLDPQSNGGALTLGLLVSLVAAVVTTALLSWGRRGPAR